jgi:aspartyl protease family protein
MRGLVFLVFAIGFFSTIIAQVASRSSTTTHKSTPDSVQNASGDESARIAELEAKNSAQFNGMDGSIELERNPDGHFYADVRINGANVRMMIDTGASIIVLSRNDAQMSGIATSIAMNDVVGRGADGAVHGEVVRLDDVELGPLSAEGLDAIVVNSGEQSLLGQSFLSKFSRVEIEGDRMILSQHS